MVPLQPACSPLIISAKKLVRSLQKNRNRL